MRPGGNVGQVAQTDPPDLGLSDSANGARIADPVVVVPVQTDSMVKT